MDSQGGDPHSCPRLEAVSPGQDGWSASPFTVPKSSIQRRPLQAGLVILCSSVGALALLSILGLGLVPFVMAASLLLLWLVTSLLIAWGGIEALAALERWLERDPRFQR